MAGLQNPEPKAKHNTSRWSSPVARQAHTLEAEGSNPSRATTHPQKTESHTRYCPIRSLIMAANSALFDRKSST